MKPIIAHFLFVLALVLFLILIIPGWIYTAFALLVGFRMKLWFFRMGEYHRRCAIVLDIAGGVLLAWPCNHLFIDLKRGYRFGEVETISFVLGINKHLGTLKGNGVAMANFLNWIDPDHVEKAVVNRFQGKNLWDLAKMFECEHQESVVWDYVKHYSPEARRNRNNA